MNKKYIQLIVGVLLVIVLAVVYFFLIPDNEGTENGEIKEQSEIENAVKITDGEIENLVCVTLKNENTLTEIVFENENWIIKGYENIGLNKNSVESFAESMLSISAQEVLNPDENISQYGLDNTNKSISLKFNDGLEKVVLVGNSTPDNAYYYAKKSDSDTIYTIDYINGKRAEYTINEFIDKSIPQVSPYKVMALNIKRKNAEEIDLEYVTEKEGNAQELISMGMETMNMKKPYNGMAVYPTNLQESVLGNLTNMELGDFVQTIYENTDKFGIDNPEVKVSINDGTNYLNLVVGNKADDINYYCTLNDKNAVFLIDEKFVKPFLDADPVKFVEKFVALHYRADILSAEILSNEKNYSITFGEEEKEENSQAENNRFTDNRKTYINGKEIDKSTFAKFFELLAGITFDKVDESAKPPTADAEVVIKYSLKDGSYDEVKFIPFNESFYVVEGTPMNGMLVSKQKVKMVFDKAESILK